MEKIVVSVLCAAYNHEKYIEKALNSIINQKTDFKFEIIVHEDASIDSTAKIIKLFEKRYPEIIKPIYQTKNQYSIARYLPLMNMHKNACGIYYAFCECDDYFTDNMKLQRQVDILESHRDYSGCIHDALKVNEAGESLKTIRGPFIKKVTQYTSDIIQNVARNYALNSLMCKSTCFDNIPQYFYDSPVMDIPLSFVIVESGPIYYLPIVMCAYRVASDNSWTIIMKNDECQYQKYNCGIQNTLKQFDKYTNYIYTKFINERLCYYEFEKLNRNAELVKILSKKYIKYYFKLNGKNKFRLVLRFLKYQLLRHFYA